MNSKKEKLDASKKEVKVLNPKALKSINGGGGKIWHSNSFQSHTFIKTTRKTNSQVSGIIYEITTNSGCVTVTSNHPFMKMDGTILNTSISQFGV